ncbi:unnamed protein product [Toxocara canis]|uniref:Uncharacterized protein n=1 Tax=Toxocara canis TaxID=6265 RepID=A0A183TYR3_TOXCA|nr:unnamed protein product [Toxocara canis]
MPNFRATITPAIGGHRCPPGSVSTAHLRFPSIYNYSREFELPVDKIKVRREARPQYHAKINLGCEEHWIAIMGANE